MNPLPPVCVLFLDLGMRLWYLDVLFYSFNLWGGEIVGRILGHPPIPPPLGTHRLLLLEAKQV